MFIGASKHTTKRVVVKRPDSQSGKLCSIPGTSTGQPSAHPSGVDKLVPIADTIEDCECKCVWLYVGLYVAKAASDAVTTCWLPAAVRRLEVDLSILTR